MGEVSTIGLDIAKSVFKFTAWTPVGERQQARAIHQVEPIDVVGLKFATCLDDGFADAPDCFSTLALRRASDEKTKLHAPLPSSGGSLAAFGARSAPEGPGT